MEHDDTVMTPLAYFATLVSPPEDGRRHPADRGRSSRSRRTSIRASTWRRRSRTSTGSPPRLKARLPADAGQVHKLRLLNRYFFQELGFSGNANDYYDPGQQLPAEGTRAASRHPDLARSPADGDRPAGRASLARRLVPGPLPRQAQGARGRPLSRSDDRRVVVARAAGGRGCRNSSRRSAPAPMSATCVTGSIAK